MSIKDRFTTGRFIYWLILLGCVIVLAIIAGAGHQYLAWLHYESVATSTPGIPIVGPDGEVGPPTSTTTPPAPGSNTATLALGQQAMLVGDITITPKEVIEDSRCPVDVQCIQAGRVRLTVAVNGVAQTITLGSSIIVGGSQINLTAVTPAKYSKVVIDPGAYRFTFTVESLSR